jgi:hypothetical protein
MKPCSLHPSMRAGRTPPVLYTLEQSAELFVDALVVDADERLLFASLYGRDASLQQLRAALSLPVAGGGFDRLTVQRPGSAARETAWVADAQRLRSISGRLPPENLFGALAQLWLYDPRLAALDHANGAGYLIEMVSAEEADATAPGLKTHAPAYAGGDVNGLWQLVCALSPLPLLTHWQKPVLTAIDPLSGMQPRCLGSLAVRHVRLGADFKEQISALVQQGVLAE